MVFQRSIRAAQQLGLQPQAGAQHEDLLADPAQVHGSEGRRLGGQPGRGLQVERQAPLGGQGVAGSAGQDRQRGPAAGQGAGRLLHSAVAPTNGDDGRAGCAQFRRQTLGIPRLPGQQEIPLPASGRETAVEQLEDGLIRPGGRVDDDGQALHGTFPYATAARRLRLRVSCKCTPV